jgi:hypothetical protein
MPFCSNHIALDFLVEREWRLRISGAARQRLYTPQVQQHVTCVAIEMHKSFDKRIEIQ